MWNWQGHDHFGPDWKDPISGKGRKEPIPVNVSSEPAYRKSRKHSKFPYFLAAIVISIFLIALLME